MAIINGDNANNNLNGTAADDTINGFGGNDILFGDTGVDIFNGGNGNDRFDVTAAAQISAGETYNGGLGVDQLFLNTGAAVDLSATIIGLDVEELVASGPVALTAAQLGNFVLVSTGAITLVSGGVADLTGATVNTTTFNLAATGNTLNLTGAINTTYTVNGAGGDDVITGGDHSSGDTLFGGEGADTINGGIGSDTLTGGGGLDTLNGGAGNDVIVVTSQAEIVAGETYNGGAGFDELDLETVFPVDLSTAIINADIERLESGGAVLLTAAQLGNFVDIQTGAITLQNAGVADLSGATVLTNNFTLAAAGNTLNLSGAVNAQYTVNGAAGNDIITGGDHSSGDTLLGNGGTDTLNGGIGNDLLVGGDGKDTMNGGLGDDRMRIFLQTEIVAAEAYNGGAGFDFLDLETGAAIDISTLTINADVEALESSGVVSLKATQLANFKSINTGAITLTGTGNANMSGDTVFTSTFNLFAGGNTLNLTGNVNNVYTVNGGAGVDVVNGGDHISGDSLTGAGGNDTLNGNAGNDSLNGGAGDDTVNGGSGDDNLFIFAQADITATETYIGGTGFDTLFLNTGAAINLGSVTINADVERLFSFGAVSVNAGQLANFKTVQASGAITLLTGGNANMSGDTVHTSTFNLFNAATTLNLSGVSNNVYTVNGGTAADTITGGDHVSGDTLSGAAGNDTINGAAGNDLLVGGAGDDTVNGGAGDDRMRIFAQAEITATETYIGGVGFDILDLETAAAIDLSTVTINADVEALESGGAVSLTVAQLSNFKNINTGAITLTNAGVANMAGDVVSTNVFNLNAAGNTLDLSGNTANVHVVNGGAGVDTITGGDHATGDTLNGGGGNDTINGGAGNDLIVGGAGVDVVNGGIGDDRMRITLQADIAAGETYTGGTGFDILDIETAAAININALTIGTDVERLESTGLLTVGAAQLGGFINVATGAITLAAAGVADLTDATVSTSVFTLANAGNTLNLSNVTTTNYTVNGANGNDIITGGDGAGGDILNGGVGTDTINGGAGNDAITGGTQRDTMDGGVGDDRLIILAQTNVVLNEVYTGGLGFDTLDIATAANIDLNGIIINSMERLESDGAVSLRHNQLDVFTNVATTGAITVLTGGAIDLSDAIVTTATFNLAAAGNSLNLTGSTGADHIIVGNAGVDTIMGGDRADQITGAGGNDNLTGGGLADQFRYTNTVVGVDTITDFSGVTAFGGGAGDTDRLAFVGLLTGVFDYVDGAAFSGGGNSEARFAAANTLEVDTNGNGTTDVTISMTGFTAATQLVNADFLWS